MTVSMNEAELAALYRPRIRELAARVRSDRRLKNPEATVSRRSHVCGSMITLDLMREQGRITALGWRSRACTLGMASLGLVTEVAVGQCRAEVAAAGAALWDLLHGQEQVFASPWEELSVFSAARGFPTRFGSIMLPFEAINEGFRQMG
ncbi:MAG: iron-sulfur cluster assembly scaffold protein [Yangia sp.]|nr:iron-sulfur cluster assembly scaffold protein [Salipiger sp.]